MRWLIQILGFSSPLILILARDTDNEALMTDS